MATIKKILGMRIYMKRSNEYLQRTEPKQVGPVIKKMIALSHFLNSTTDKFKQMVESGEYDINNNAYRTQGLNYPLGWAAENSEHEKAQVLIDAGAILYHDLTSEYKATALHEIVYYNDFEMAKILIGAGYDINARDRDNHTGLYNHLHPYNKDKTKPMIKLFLSSGAEIDGNPNSVKDGLSQMQWVESILGNEMPKLVEVRKDDAGNPIYRQEGAKTFAELTEFAFKKNANDVVAQIIGISGGSSADTLNAGFVSQYLNRTDIENVFNTVAIRDENGNPVNSEVLKDMDNEQSKNELAKDLLRKQQLRLGNFDHAKTLIIKEVGAAKSQSVGIQ
jgi:ankyrin repeat protein